MFVQNKYYTVSIMHTLFLMQIFWDYFPSENLNEP